MCKQNCSAFRKLEGELDREVRTKDKYLWNNPQVIAESMGVEEISDKYNLQRGAQ